MTKETGGPAFPGVDETGEPYSGMTLRDYFAAKALQALVTSAPYDQPLGHTGVAQVSYSLADAMLEARK